MLRVLLVTLAFAPGVVSPFPGVNRYSTQLAASLSREDVEVTVATPRYFGSAPQEHWGNIEILRLLDSKALAGPVGSVADMHLLTFGLNLGRFLRRSHSFDVIQTDIPMPWIHKIWNHPPIIGVIHHVYKSWTGLDALTSPFGALYQRRAITAADSIVVPSHATAHDVIARYRADPAKVVVIYPGVDTSVFAPERANHNPTPRDGATLLYVGLLENRKGAIDLIEIIRQVRAEIPAAVLWIVGMGPLEARLEALVDKKQLRQAVKFLGNVKDEDLVTRLRLADIFVFPSHLEGFGLVMAEAMACGLPIVAYDTPTGREVLRDSGVLIQHGNITAFSQAVAYMLRHPGRRQSAAARGLRIVQDHYVWTRAARQYKVLYETLLDHRRSAVLRSGPP